MQHLLQASPILDKFKHIQQVLSFRIQLTTSQKVALWSLGVVGTSAVVVGVLSRYLARRRAKPIFNPRIQRAINKRLSRMRSPNGGMGSVASSGGRSSPLGFSERLSMASGSIGSGGGGDAPLSPQQLGVMEMAPPRKIVRRQLEIMIDFLEENKDMSKGIPPSSPMTHQTIKENWIKLTKRLNGIEGGAKKAPDGWKKYWFEWRHRCRKKAANARRFQAKSTGGSHRFVPLNDLEVRVLDLNGKGSVSATVPSSKKLENFLAEDSDSNNAIEDAEPLFSEMSQQVKRRSTTDNYSRSGTPPPKWALELEDRRIAAEERMANALESIANSMRLQEERQGMIEERIADALTSIAGTLQDLSNGSQKNVLQHLHHSQPDHNETSSMKDVIFL